MLEAWAFIPFVAYFNTCMRASPTTKSLSTLATATICHRKRRLSQKTATVAVLRLSQFSATVAVFGNSVDRA